MHEITAKLKAIRDTIDDERIKNELDEVIQMINEHYPMMEEEMSSNEPEGETQKVVVIKQKRGKTEVSREVI